MEKEKDKKVQWNFKDVPQDIFALVMDIQCKMKIAKRKDTSIQKICFALMRRGAAAAGMETGKKEIKNT